MHKYLGYLLRCCKQSASVRSRIKGTYYHDFVKRGMGQDDKRDSFIVHGSYFSAFTHVPAPELASRITSSQRECKSDEGIKATNGPSREIESERVKVEEIKWRRKNGKEIALIIWVQQTHTYFFVVFFNCAPSADT